MSKTPYEELWEIYRALGADALSLNHYDLAEVTTIDDPEIWKAFLLDPDVEKWRESEIKLIQDSELKKMIQGANKSRSVGQAQLINTLAKLKEDKNVKEGPIFIYCYVPLNTDQAQAENIVTLPEDPFIKRGDI